MGLSPDETKRKKQIGNLRPFTKGHNGRPRQPTGHPNLKLRLQQALLEVSLSDKEQRQWAEVFVRQELARAIKGDKDARETIWKLFEEDARHGDGFGKLIIEHVFSGKPYHSPGIVSDAAEDCE